MVDKDNKKKVTGVEQKRYMEEPNESKKRIDT